MELATTPKPLKGSSAGLPTGEVCERVSQVRQPNLVRLNSGIDEQIILRVGSAVRRRPAPSALPRFMMPVPLQLSEHAMLLSESVDGFVSAAALSILNTSCRFTMRRVNENAFKFRELLQETDAAQDLAEKQRFAAVVDDLSQNERALIEQIRAKRLGKQDGHLVINNDVLAVISRIPAVLSNPANDRLLSRKFRQKTHPSVNGILWRIAFEVSSLRRSSSDASLQKLPIFPASFVKQVFLGLDSVVSLWDTAERDENTGAASRTERPM